MFRSKDHPVGATLSLGSATKPHGAAWRPPPPAQRSTAKEKVRGQSSARLQRHTCREYIPPPTPTNSVIVWCILMYFVLLSGFHSVLSDPCFDSVCQTMRM